MASTAVELDVISIELETSVPIVVEVGQLEGPVIRMATGAIDHALRVAELPDVRVGMATHAVAPCGSAQASASCSGGAIQQGARWHQHRGRVRIMTGDASLLRMGAA